jgi:hypothetical protein
MCSLNLQHLQGAQKKDVKPRPIISSVNSIPELFSKRVNYWLKTAIGKLLLTYIKDAEHLVQYLHATFSNGLPPGAKLFSVYAIGMYSNIDIDHGIDVMILSNTMPTYHHQCQLIVFSSLAKIMCNKIFQFEDSFWRQKEAMP